MNGLEDSDFLPINDTIISEFVDSGSSSFEFELQVLRRLRALGYSCDHSGIYFDPQTEKMREFDIRARKSLTNASGLSDVKGSIAVAVECKHLNPNFPLVGYRTPRRLEESFHTVQVSPRFGRVCEGKGSLCELVSQSIDDRPVLSHFRHEAFKDKNLLGILAN